MKLAKLFKHGQNQMFILPKEFRFDGDEVVIKKVGKVVVLMPVNNTFDTLFDSLDEFSDDFMSERNQPVK